MRKMNTMKKALAIIMLTGALCACGNTEPAAQDESSVTSAETTTVTETTAENDSSDTSSEEEQNSDKGDIIKEDVQSVSIRYYIGYNIASGDIIKDSIPCYTVELTDDKLARAADMLCGLSKIPADKDPEEYGNIIFMDYYELKINDDVTLQIGDEYGTVSSSNVIFEVPEGLFELVEQAAEAYNEENVYKYLTSDQMTVTDKDGNSSDVTDEEQLKKMQSIPYYDINLTDKDFEGESVAYTIDTHDGETMDIYFASVLGKHNHSDGTYEYVNIYGMEDYLDDIYKYTDSRRAEHGIEE